MKSKVQFFSRNMWPMVVSAILVVNIGCGVKNQNGQAGAAGGNTPTPPGRTAGGEARTPEEARMRLNIAVRGLQARWDNVLSEHEWLAELEPTPLGISNTGPDGSAVAYAARQSECEREGLFDCVNAGSTTLMTAAEVQPQEVERETSEEGFRYLRLARLNAFFIAEIGQISSRDQIGDIADDDACPELADRSAEQIRQCGNIYAETLTQGRRIRIVYRLGEDVLPLTSGPMVIALTPERKDRINELFWELIDPANKIAARNENHWVQNGVAGTDRRAVLESLWQDLPVDFEPVVLGVTFDSSVTLPTLAEFPMQDDRGAPAETEAAPSEEEPGFEEDARSDDDASDSEPPAVR